MYLDLGSGTSPVGNIYALFSEVICRKLLVVSQSVGCFVGLKFSVEGCNFIFINLLMQT